jgi:hypothetical protein
MISSRINFIACSSPFYDPTRYQIQWAGDRVFYPGLAGVGNPKIRSRNKLSNKKFAHQLGMLYNQFGSIPDTGFQH